VRFDGKDGDALNKKILYFPRYHQLDVVRKLIADAGKKGVCMSSKQTELSLRECFVI
jgi:hypothetical protein